MFNVSAGPAKPPAAERSITMKTPLITVKSAGPARPLGFGRIELHVARVAGADFLDQNRESRALASAAYKVAAQLEESAGFNGFDCEVDATQAAQGIIKVDFRHDRLDEDVIGDILIEACGDCGLQPIDALVEIGAIDPTAAGKAVRQ
jgi:hypothetical protein